MIRRNNPYKRYDRVSSELRKIVSEIIEMRVKDIKLRGVVVTDLVLSKDLRYAKVFVSSIISSINQDVNKKTVLKSLDNAKGYIKNIVSDKIRLRYMPEFTFLYDDSADYGFKIDNLLKEIKSDSNDREDR